MTAHPELCITTSQLRGSPPFAWASQKRYEAAREKSMIELASTPQPGKVNSVAVGLITKSFTRSTPEDLHAFYFNG